MYANHLKQQEPHNIHHIQSTQEQLATLTLKEEESKALQSVISESFENIEKEEEKSAREIEEILVHNLHRDQPSDIKVVEAETRENIKADIILKEEEELDRRAAKEALQKQSPERSATNFTIEEIKEEGENELLEADRRKTAKAEVIIKEEQERARRVALNGLEDEISKERSLENRAHSRIVEEEEKQRRVAEDNYYVLLEADRRETAKAEVIIKEEQERARRIAEDNLYVEIEKERSEENRAYSRIQEEEERARRIAELEYQKGLKTPTKISFICGEIQQKVPQIPPHEPK